MPHCDAACYVAPLQPMIIASAAFYGILPKAAEFVGLVGVANFIYGLQATGWGLLVYGLLVFAMEFLPFGAVNPPEVAEYFTMVGAVICIQAVIVLKRVLAQQVKVHEVFAGVLCTMPGTGCCFADSTSDVPHAHSIEPARWDGLAACLPRR